MTLIEALRRHSTLFVFSTGMAVGIVPLVIFRAGGFADPYDEPLSHLWWIAGFVGLGTLGSVIRPQMRWSLALLCGLGFLMAATIMTLIELKLAIATQNLWPFSLIFTLFYGLTLALIGACLGKIAVRSIGHREG